jgi:glycosyltransferase involved in cell wall biosynthesis
VAADGPTARQPNAGAGSGRNNGLNAVPDDVTYVALLDPDDVWADDHLEQAMAAMRPGYDFYFRDVRSECDSIGHFARCGMDRADRTMLSPHLDLCAVALLLTWLLAGRPDGVERQLLTIIWTRLRARTARRHALAEIRFRNPTREPAPASLPPDRAHREY